MIRSSRFGFALLAVAFAVSLVYLTRESTTSFAQQPNLPPPNRKPACSCFCGDPTFDSFNIFSKEDIAAGKCYGGPLGTAACGETLRELPGDQLRALCQQAKAKGKVCPALAPVCDEPPPESGCQKPTPWFDSSDGCPDIQKPQVTVTASAVRVSFCGLQVFQAAVKDNSDMYRLVLTGWVESRVGSKVCCSKLRDAIKTAKPCDPSADIDCDGILNQADVNTTEVPGYPVPQIDLFTRPPGAAIDKFPDGLNPDDPDFLPNRTARDSAGVGECACKWELIKGELKCSPDGKQQHVYVATWRCPVTKAEVVTTKYAPATAPCAKSRAERLSESLLTFEELSSREEKCGSGGGNGMLSETSVFSAFLANRL